MVKLKLDLELLKHLLNEKFDGKVLLLLYAWDKNYKDGPNKATVYGWLKGRSTPNSENYCRLCGLLDIDPFVLLRLDEPEIGSYFHLRNYVIKDKWHSIKTLKFINDFLWNAHDWPPNEFSNKYYNRNWTTVDFIHDESKKRNFYQEIKLTSLLNEDVEIPVVYHFAFLNQRPSVYWNQYGFIMRYKNQHKLFHINGESDEFKEYRKNKIARVETFFGQHGAKFRIASIHPFKLKLVKSSPNSVKKLRFK